MEAPPRTCFLLLLLFKNIVTTVEQGPGQKLMKQRAVCPPAPPRPAPSGAASQTCLRGHKHAPVLTRVVGSRQSYRSTGARLRRPLFLTQVELGCPVLRPGSSVWLDPGLGSGCQHRGRPSGSGAGLAGDREEREELPLQPGCAAAAAGGRRPVPPAERHGLCPHGEDLPRDLQVRTAPPKR